MVDEYADAEYTAGTYPEECPDLSLLAHRPHWQRQASCRGAGTDSWFPMAGGPNNTAKAVCEACPVRCSCLEYAIASSRVLQGIWAGTTEEERAPMRRARKAGASPVPIESATELLVTACQPLGREDLFPL